MSSVDVVIPCYNYARFLPRCVSSVLAQEGVDLRILIIDDCSTDDTPDVARQLQARDSRIEVRRHAANRGHIATYNEGLLEWARADYSLLISADDLLAPGALARAARVMDRHPEVSMTYGMCFVVAPESEAVVPPPETSDQYQLIDSLTFMREMFLVTNVVPTPTAVVRTVRQQQIGGYRPHLPHSGDQEMWLRVATTGTIGVVRATQAYYRRHSGSMSARYHAHAVSDRRERIDAYDEAARVGLIKFPELAELLQAAKNRMALEALWLAGIAFERGDDKSVAECAAFATEVWPGIRRSPHWVRFAAKRAIGRKAILGFRRLFAVPAEAPERPGANPGPRQISWWPPGPPLVDRTLTSPASRQANDIVQS